MSHLHKFKSRYLRGDDPDDTDLSVQFCFFGYGAVSSSYIIIDIVCICIFSIQSGYEESPRGREDLSLQIETKKQRAMRKLESVMVCILCYGIIYFTMS